MRMPVSSICSGCGYDLSGLGQRGRCPECGRKFDTISGRGLVDSSAEAGRRGERVARRLGLIVLMALALAALACGGGLALMAEDWRYPLAMGALVAIVLGMWAASHYFEGKERGGSGERNRGR